MARKRNTPHVPAATPRHLWLAGLGLVAIASREASTVVETAVDRAEALRRDVTVTVEAAQARANELFAEARERADDLVADARERADALVADARQRAGAAFDPLIALLEPKKPARRVARRRPVKAKKAPARRATAKQAAPRRRARKA